MFFSAKFSSDRLVYDTLLHVGVHVGHSLSCTNIYAAWMILGLRQSIAIIDLNKFLFVFRVSLSFLERCIFRKRSIWFVNQDKTFEKYVRSPAISCGEFSSTIYWIRGLISNFNMALKARRRLLYLSDLVKMRKSMLSYFNFKLWFLTRSVRPGLLFVSNVLKSNFAISEAFSSSIPCIGIVDTNCYSQHITFALPGNDDSISCVVFYNLLISEFILYRKFVKVLVWFVYIRRPTRFVEFFSWALNGLFLRKFVSYSFLFDGSFSFNLYDLVK